MTSSLSDTLAMVKDTVARVKILEHDSISGIEGSDSAVIEHTLLKKDCPTDLLDTARADCYSNYTIHLASDTTDTLHHTVVLKDIPGVYGIPKDTDIMRNDLVTAVILICFFVTIAIFSVARDYITRQTKKFFSNIFDSRSNTAETINEVKLNIYFALQTCLIFSIITYFFVISFADTERFTFPITAVIPIATAGYLLYFIIKYILYIITDSVFYEDRKIRRQHTDDFFYIMTVQGLLLFPALLLSISTGIELPSLAIYVAIVIILAKLLVFYKTICTFSVHYKSFLQIILYFCALEMIPLMSLCGILEMIAKYL